MQLSCAFPGNRVRNSSRDIFPHDRRGEFNSRKFDVGCLRTGYVPYILCRSCPSWCIKISRTKGTPSSCITVRPCVDCVEPRDNSDVAPFWWFDSTNFSISIITRCLLFAMQIDFIQRSVSPSTHSCRITWFFSFLLLFNLFNFLNLVISNCN